jgi:hypothetical protein
MAAQNFVARMRFITKPSSSRFWKFYADSTVISDALIKIKLTSISDDTLSRPDAQSGNLRDRAATMLYTLPAPLLPKPYP